MYQGGRGDAVPSQWELYREQARCTSWCPRPSGQTRMMYDGTFDSIELILHLSAILGAREIEAWGRPPLDSKEGNRPRRRSHLTKTK